MCEKQKTEKLVWPTIKSICLARTGPEFKHLHNPNKRDGERGRERERERKREREREKERETILFLPLTSEKMF
jgi:hypothetical protein